MGELKLTDQQHAAVYDRGGSLLLSAAAGSGKTKVLVERVFSYLTQERCDVDDFLIITFTRAAAAELRARLASELSARVAASPEDRHLRRQMFRVYQADIKTVDAFCASLLRENIHLLSGRWRHSIRTLKTATRSSRCWRVRWARDGTTGSWWSWCWSCTRRSRATPTRCGGCIRRRRAGGTCRRLWPTAYTAGRSWRIPCARRCSGRSSWSGPWTP